MWTILYVRARTPSHATRASEEVWHAWCTYGTAVPVTPRWSKNLSLAPGRTANLPKNLSLASDPVRS